MDRQERSAISLFSGCGGCSLGLRQAGFDVRLAVDIAEAACETYALNLGGGAVWRADLSTARPEEIVARAGLGATPVDLIVGGPPCQGFSSAGARDWSDVRNALLRQFVDIVTRIRPTWFLMENVEGLLTAKGGFFIIEAVTRFLEAGYWVRVEKVYMEQFSLPQRRKRVLVVGNLEECQFAFPLRLASKKAQASFFERGPRLSLLDAIGDLPPASESGVVRYDRQAANAYQAGLRCADGRPVRHHRAKPVNDVTRDRIRALVEGATMKALPEHLRHPSFTKRAFRRVMDGTPTEKRGGAPAGLKRLVGAEPSLTITSAAPAEFVHPAQDRLLTLRECARIQSFPDWFEFCGSWGSVATQIGNAIPPLFMYQVATHIKGIARWRPAPPTRGRWLGVNATRSTGLSPALAAMLDNLQERAGVYAR